MAKACYKNYKPSLHRQGYCTVKHTVNKLCKMGTDYKAVITQAPNELTDTRLGESISN